MKYVYFSLRQTEHNDQYSSDNVYNNLIFPQKSSDCAGKQSERAEYDGKAKHKTKRSQKTLCFLSALPAKYEIYSGKSGSIQGEMKEIKPSKR